jgi:RNA polymerase sigma factor (sigma-70 family)
MSRMLGADAERLLRELVPQALGAVIRRFRDFATAEDAVQEALIAATLQWPDEGIPTNPRGWLIQVASRRMTDHLRSEIARRRREAVVAVHPDEVAPAFDQASANGSDAGDDALTLLFMCCHESLTPPSAIALTLRAVGGLTTQEIARAFLVPESTMAQRITRAKSSIKASGAPFRPPNAQEQPERLRVVLHVLYLIFSEGYVTSGGVHLQRDELAHEAIRMTRMLRNSLPDNAEAAGLLALMLLTDARRMARTGPAGELIPLTKQDRLLWDRAAITEGVSILTAALAKGSIGPYQLQAAIAAVHDEAPRAEDTDWPQILALYDLLKRMSPNPMVILNHAIAAAMVHGPSTGLDLLNALDGDSRVSSHHRLDAVRAHLHEMAGDREAAIAHYRAAARRTASLPERNYLLSQAAQLRDQAALPEEG